MCAAEESTLAKPQTNTGNKSEWISLWNSKHDPITGCVDLEAIEAYSFINLERKACAHGIWKCFPPLNRVHMVALLSTAAWRAHDWQRQEAPALCAPLKWFFFRRRYLMEGRGTWHYLKSLCAHGGNYVKLCSSATLPVGMKSQKSSSQPLLCVRSPAISPSMQQCTILVSADPSS